MENARVAVFEDDADWRLIVEEIVEDSGHSLIFSATNMEEARTTIDQLEDDGLDVAIIDGNLTPNTANGADGKEITRLLREKLGNVMIIGFSATHDVEGADVSLRKTGYPRREIPAIINRL